MPNPFTSLLDLDRGRLPGLRLRLDGEEYPLRAPEALTLGEAFELGDLFSRLVRRHAAGTRRDAIVQQIVAIVAPGLRGELGPRQSLSLVAFYSVHLMHAVKWLGTPAGDPVPFSTPARDSSRRHASRRDSAPDSASSSPCR